MEAARLRYTEAVLELGILRILRALIDQLTAASYGTSLTVDEAPGLTESTTDDLDVSTSATESLQRLMESMGSGSIGISGPRGVGKTTLLRAFHLGKYPIRRENVERPLSVMVSAPVVYDGRDFVLHLFSKLCHAVIGPHDQPSDLSDTEGPERPERFGRTRKAILWGVRWLAVAAVLAGVALLLVAWLAPDQADRLVPAIVLLAIAMTLGLARREISRGLASAIRPVAIALFAAGIALFLLGVVDSTASEMVLWGTALLLAGVAIIRALVVARASWPADPEPVPDLSADGRYDRDYVARQWRDRIHFQQTYTSGWSGGLKLPVVGLEGGITGSTAISNQQMTFPDVVEELRKFIVLAGFPGDVLIAIDELDKMESDETAHRFLNEIKGIFGVERCFFLVSVSEDAMSAFERRGLPVRDVFDSSFDEILFMHYLTLEESRLLLRERVIGLSVPFLLLAHSLSGGLARDLIRVTRSMIDIRAQAMSDVPISQVARDVIRRELSRKVRAVTVAVRSSQLEPHVSNMLLWAGELDELCDGNPTADALLGRCEGVHDFIETKLPLNSNDGNPERQESDRQERDRLADLCFELGVVTYFGATVLAYFRDEMTQAELRAAENDARNRSGIETLAKARQAFATNKRIAWARISSFRESTPGIGNALAAPTDAGVSRRSNGRTPQQPPAPMSQN